MKIILGFIAFILAFGFSTTLVGLLFGFPQPSQANYLTTNTSSSSSYSIEQFLKRDVRNGYTRHRTARKVYQSAGSDIELYSDSNYRKTVLRYVQRSSSMSDAGLPRDFQYAWRNHMKAWKKQAAYVRSFEIVDVSNQNSFSIRGADNTREINETWDQVLRIAQRYGVRIDRTYYQ